MARLKPGFILEQRSDLATRERWFHELLGEHPELLDEVAYVHLQTGVEPTLCFSATAAKGFLIWCVQKGYGDTERLEDSLAFFEAEG